MNIADTTNAIISANKSILLSDTCSLLDVFRAQYRANVNISHVIGFTKILKLMDSGSIKSVISYTVKDEFLNNEALVSVELEKTINKLIQNNERFINILQMMGISYEFHLSGIENTQLVQTIKNGLKKFINNSIILDKNSSAVSNALLRFEKNEAPSSSNKKEMKDCLIIDHYLQLSEQLRKNGFAENIFFITSNSTDYGKINSLKTPIDVQFPKLKILYRNNYHWIVSEL